MIEDILDIVRSATDWMDPEDVVNQLRLRDPVRYRNVTREYVNQRVRKLQFQHYPVQTAQFWDAPTRRWLLRIKWREQIKPRAEARITNQEEQS